MSDKAEAGNHIKIFVIFSSRENKMKIKFDVDKFMWIIKFLSSKLFLFYFFSCFHYRNIEIEINTCS
jgi:hypothetical protein